MGRKLHITSSIGIALYPEDGEGAEPLLRNADAAMYRVKESGRNGYDFHTPAMYAEAFGRLELETGIRSALENDEFVIHYQPQVSVATGRIVGAEALVRWMSPNGILLPPSEFIPLAEESGLIVGLGEWILRAVCRDIHRWRDIGLPGLPIAVNFSARQFEHPNLTDLISSILRETGVDPRWLRGKPLDNGLRDVKHTKETLRKPDIGTGLRRLRDWPRIAQLSEALDSLKIDCSLSRPRGRRTEPGNNNRHRGPWPGDEATRGGGGSRDNPAVGVPAVPRLRCLSRSSLQQSDTR
jgi:hypothetical protein